MMPEFTSIENYRKKFYQKEVDFKKFLELSEEQLSMLAKKVYKMQEILDDTISQFPTRSPQLDKYQRTLQYLIGPNINLEFRTYDERVAYLIMMTDPNLITFKEFLKLDLISLTELAKIENEKERNYLKKIRNQTISTYEYLIREKIGFYDIRLLKYEEQFFRRFFCEKELVTEVRNSNQDNLLNKAKILKDFNSISDKRYDELVDMAQTWLSLVPNKYNSKIATYSVTNQYKLFGLKNTVEQLALFILLIDSDLEMLRIYEEESMIKDIEKRIIEQFGYFNNDLILLEKKFHDRFYPDKNISVWSKQKNVRN